MKRFRILDANINRACEGIRVLEDISRFDFEDMVSTNELREMRHRVRKLFLPMDHRLLLARDSKKDIGKTISSNSDLDKKEGIKNLIFGNFKRVNEALRTIEEISKIIGEYNVSKDIENLRFCSYEIEKNMSKNFKKVIPEGIYGITGEKFANGRSNIECVKSMIDGGIKIIQYREKEKSIKEKVAEVIEIRTICHENDITFIVNDHVDIAILVDADGVHVGQDDMDISHVRKLIGENKIIGKSTHCLEDAKKAILDGADYIGVGPIFKTTTKEKDPVGLGYLEEVVKNIELPFVAIGGIKESNIEEVKKLGATSICLVSEIVGAENIVEKIKKLNEIIGG